MGSPSRNVQYHPPRLSEDRLNLPQPHSPSFAYTLLREIGNAPGRTFRLVPDEPATWECPARAGTNPLRRARTARGWGAPRARAGMNQVVVTLLIPGRPDLFLSHEPLESVPAGTVNVHGHIHDTPSPTTDRHLNVSVEQLDYRPVRLEELENLAREPTNDKLIGTTAERVKAWRHGTGRHRRAEGKSASTGTINRPRP